MTPEQLKYYQDYIIPRMPNVDHTPAIEYINFLLAGKRATHLSAAIELTDIIQSLKDIEKELHG